ncbi:Zinc finger FYVE domain protein [Quillaja saponaria]|uniref:Zinc finger FYVE domain protein n=1 Tax=Quillaja saponaria TaxID=32244 RepID=A0AAD7PK75_QUISA|nr:Zinc finger FYVE domain protein [Quillaja saponaria]KAJ7958691.1 Zinc finger FYVE domain protein [Quillaja saponaria]
MDKETQILSRLAANHLYLAQFEPFRATLLALRTRNPVLARSILQTIVAHSGRFRNILWSSSCSSPAFLTYLSTLELLQFDNATSAWNLEPEALRLRAEFLLLVQNLITRISESIGMNKDLGSIETEKDVVNGNGNVEERAKQSKGVNGELDNCAKVLDGVLELGVRRLKADFDNDMDGSETGTSSAASIEQGDLMSLRTAILDHPDVFDAFCWNINRQIRGWEGYNTGLAIMLPRDEDAGVDLSEEEDVKVLSSIEKTVQLAHLDAMKERLKEGDVEGPVSHIRFLSP